MYVKWALGSFQCQVKNESGLSRGVRKLSETTKRQIVNHSVKAEWPWPRDIFGEPRVLETSGCVPQILIV